VETSNPIGSFEVSCAQAEASGRAAVAAAKRLEKAARGLEQAARVGDATKLGKQAGELNAAIADSDDALKRARAAWPHSEADVSAYLEGPFGDELLEVAQKSGCKLARLDDRWTAFPVVLEVAPKTRSVKIDGKRLTALRPAAVVREVLRRQAAQGVKPERFIEILYSGYRALGQARGVHLADVYELLTILPEAKASYSRADFARDIYLLDSSPVRTTKDGSVVSFMGATGTKGSTKVLTVIPPDGMPKHYHAVLFSGNA
jgi:hypothetical protein